MTIRCNDTRKKQVITSNHVLNQTFITIIYIIYIKIVKYIVILKTKNRHIDSANLNYV
jgi:hypothetical protein